MPGKQGQKKYMFIKKKRAAQKCAALFYFMTLN